MPDTPEPARWRARMIPPVWKGDAVMLTPEAVAGLVGQQFAVGTIVGASVDDEGWVVVDVESVNLPVDLKPNDDYSIAVGAHVDAPLVGLEAQVVGTPAEPRVIRNLDVYEVSLVIHHPHPGMVVLSRENPVCTCGVGFVEDLGVQP